MRKERETRAAAKSSVRGEAHGKDTRSELGAEARVSGEKRKKKRDNEKRKARASEEKNGDENKKREKQNRPESTRETAAVGTQRAQLQQ